MKAKIIRKIDRSSPMPVYQQIANDIVTRISQDEWSIGGKLPSENELSLEYEASRVTIRQALAKLEADGLIDKQRGRGAFRLIPGFPSSARPAPKFTAVWGSKRGQSLSTWNEPSFAMAKS